MERLLEKLRLNRTDPFVLAILLLAGIKYTFGVSHILDVALYDESFYLHSGATLPQAGLTTPEFGPLYQIWYYLLSRVQPDRVALYYLNYVLTTVLPPMALYVLMRVNRVPIVAGAAVAGYVLITQANFVTWPRPTHLALLVVLASCTLVSFVSRRATGVLVAAFGALLAAYVRPEYFLAFLLLLALGAALSVVGQRRAASPSGWLSLGAVGAASALLLAIFGLPAFGKGGGERHFFAFAQHFALNWSRWNGVDAEGPYNVATNFREIAARSFGNAATVSAALRNNPAAFARHVFTNVSQLIPRFPGLFLHHENIFLPNGMRFENIEARLTLLALLGLLWFTRQTWRPALASNARRHGLLVVCVGLFCVPAAVSAVEIYPHDHYLLLPGVLLIALAVVFLKGEDNDVPPLTPQRTALLALAMLAVMPMVSHRPPVGNPNVATIRAIASLGVTKERVNLLEAEGGYDFYETANYHRVPEYDKRTAFDQFLSAQGINMIALTDKLRRDSRFAPDPAWQAFLTRYPDAGFEAREVSGTNTTLLVRHELLLKR